MLYFSSANNLIVILALAFVILAITLTLFGLREAIADAQLIKTRLAGHRPEDRKLSILRHRKAFDSFSNHLTLPDDDEVSEIRAWLARAGYYGTSSVKYYYALRILFLVVPQLVSMSGLALFGAGLDQQLKLFISCGLIILGMMLPPAFIRRRINQRRQKIKDGFPDMMDLMVAVKVF